MGCIKNNMKEFSGFKQFESGERTIQKANKELQELIKYQHDLEERIKELEAQEIGDDTGLSNAMDTMKAKEQLEETKEKIRMILEKDTNNPEDSLIDHMNDFQN